MPILKPQGQDLIKFCITVQFHERYLLCTFFSSNLIYCGQKQPIQVKFLDFWVVGWKFTKFQIPYVIFETTSQFSLNFASKKPIKVQISRLSTAQVKFHQICTLIGSFCWKYIKFQLKKYRGVMSHDTEEWCKIWRKTNLLFQKWQEFGEFWSKHTKVSKMCTLIGHFRAKYITFDLKKYRGVIFHDTEESCKIWRKTDLWFGKWHEEFGRFSSEHLKMSKLVLSWGPFVENRKCTS